MMQMKKEKSGMSTEIFVEKMQEDAVLPKYAHDGDAGMDLYSVTDVVIQPGETVLIHTGLKFAIPVGYEVQIRPRSGLSLNTPLRIPNAPGTIDSGYRGEICIIMENTSSEKYAASCCRPENERSRIPHDGSCLYFLSVTKWIYSKTASSVGSCAVYMYSPIWGQFISGMASCILMQLPYFSWISSWECTYS